MPRSENVSGSQTSGSSAGTKSLGVLPLNHSNLDLVGRDEEINVLQQTFDRVCQAGAASEILVVSGESGSGKSALVQKLGSSIDESKGFFVSGKYGQFEDSRPAYGALVDAVTELCFAIRENDKLEHVRSSIEDVLAEESIVLIKLIPTIRLVVVSHEDFQDNMSNEFSYQRFIYLFRSFLNAVAKVHPVVLFLDDLQWADEASRELLDSFSKDTQSQNLLLIGAIRSDEESRPFQLPSDTVLPTFRLEIGPLSEESVNQVITSLIERKVSQTEELSRIVTSKTHGNAFFVIQYVEMLHREGLLAFNFGSNLWEWDAEKIVSRTDVSDNVAQLLIDKISRLSNDVQAVLMAAACLGFTLDMKALEEVVLKADLLSGDQASEEKKTESNQDGGQLAFQGALGAATRAGLLEEASGGRLKFSHDRVQQSTFQMIPDNRKGEGLQSKIGHVVLDMSKSEGSEEWMLFVSVHLLTKYSSLPSSHEKKKMAELCLMAAKKAAEKSAFISAAQFADKGLSLIPSDHWDRHYDLSLELYTLSARMHYAYGDFETAEEVISVIMNRARSRDEKLPASLVRVAILGARTDLQGGIKEGSTILRWLGIRVPPRANTLQLFLATKKVNRLLQGRKPKDMLDLPIMTDKKMEEAMRLLAALTVYDWRGGENNLLVLHVLLMMQLTLKHGLGCYGPYAISLYGAVLAHAGALQEAYDYGGVAEELFPRTNSREGKANTLKITHLFLWHMKKPIYDSLAPSLLAYRTAKEIGDVMIAVYCLQMHGMFGVIIGMPLEHLEEEMRGYCDVCREFRQEACLMELLPFYQLAMNLRGMTEDPLVLTGSGMDEEKFVKSLEKSNEGSSSLLLLAYARTLLLYLFDELELAEVERKKVSPRNDFVSAYFAKVTNFFWCGLTCLGLARKTGDHKHVRNARPYIKELKKLASFGSVNCVHMLKLLLAEERALTDRSGTVTKEYDSAISMAGRSGFRLIKAVALERAGVYMLDCGDESMAADYLRRSWVEFEEYGAKAKLSHMKSKYSSVTFDSSNLGPQKVSQRLQPHVVEQWNQQV